MLMIEHFTNLVHMLMMINQLNSIYNVVINKSASCEKI